MATLRATIDIASPPKPVWDLISRFEHWPVWGVTITAVGPAAGRVATGMSGRVRTVAGLWLPFVITDVVDGSSWNWKVAGIPATGHRVDQTEGGCRVTFTAPLWAPFYVPVLSRALDLLDGAVTGP